MRLYLLVSVIAAVITYLLTAVMRRLSLDWAILTPVRERDVHTTPIPRLGGVAMSIGFIISVLFASKLPYFQPVFENSLVFSVLLGVFAITLLGAIDDIWELDWVAKLAGQILVALLMAYNGVQLISFPIFGLTIGSAQLSLVATVFVIVAIMNAVNFVDGLDGLAAGVVGIGALAFFTYTYVLTRLSGALTYATTASLLTAALVGICVGFLPYNFHPGSIFMGDSGALMLGTVVSAAGIIVTGQIDPAVLGESQVYTSILPIALPLLVIVLPIMDMTLAVIRRLRAGQSPFQADRLHLHHRLLNLGHSHTRVVLLMYLWTAVITFPVVGLLLYPAEYVAMAAAGGFLVAMLSTLNFLPGLRRLLFKERG